jgi:cell division protein FtsL
MSLQYQGNLALKTAPVAEKQYKQSTRKVQMKKTLPRKEKMLYLASVVVCGLVAFIVILNSSFIYQTNLNVQETKQQIKELGQENVILQVQINELQEPKRLEKLGKMLGYSTQSTDQTKLVQSGVTPVAGQSASVAVNVR